MAREEEEFKYDSSSAPGTPSNLTPGTPRNSEKRIKNGLKKLIPFTKNKSELDKSEKGFGKDEAGASPSRRTHFNLFKSLRSHKHEDGAHTTKNDEPKPGYNEKTQNPSEKNKELHEKDRPRNEALKEENKPSKHNLPVDTLGEVLNLPERAKGESQNQPHKQTQATIDDKFKSKVHQELKMIVGSVVKEKEVVKHDQQNHHKQNEDHKCDIKDENLVVACEAVEEQSPRLDSPPPPLQENNVVETKCKLRNETLKEETKPSKHNHHHLSTETIGEVLKLFERVEESQNHLHKQTQATTDDKGKSKEHREELKVVANAMQEKEVVKHDQQNHHKQTEDPKADAKDEKLVATSEAMEKQSRDISALHPPILQKDVVGCESLVKGLQKICLPWTIDKEDH